MEKEVKAVRLFPILHDISDFIEQDHPKLHPDTSEYVKYWERVERLCIEGKWGHDYNKDTGEGGYRYCPPTLYYYVNCCIIADEDEGGNTTALIHPMLRDIEWIFATSWLSARGFSGFEKDEEHTSYRLIGLLESGTELTGKQKLMLEKKKAHLTKPDGTWKKYVEAREYLSQTHAKPLGLPYYDNEALNLFCLSSRGIGKSYYCANGVIGHEYTFYGKKRFDDSYLVDPAPVEIFVGAALGTFSGDLLKKFSQTRNYQRDKLGAYGSGDEFIPGYFFSNSKGTLDPNNKAKNPFEHYYKYEEGGVWKTGGTGSKIFHGIYTSENPQSAVGTRPTVMVIEEVGLLGNVMAVQASNETCQIRRTKFGSSYYIGTGGNMEKIIECKAIFEDPISYNFLPFVDHWENRTNPIGLFIPGYYADNTFKDKQGNTDVDASLKEELHQRALREKAASSTALDGYMMARPIVPSEMFLSPTANIFPTAKLRSQLIDVETKDTFNLMASMGSLEWETPEHKSVVWQEDVRRKKKPILLLNLDSYQNEIEGTVVIYEHPPDRLPPAKYQNNLYKVCYDPVKDDGGGTSLCSIIVHKGFSEQSWEGGMQDTIVAEYIGRHERVNDMHEIAVKLALYFNAKIMVEVNLPDFVRYCRMKSYYHLLQYSPYVAISKAIKNPGKKYDVGITMSKQLSIHCEILLRQWLLETWKTTEEGKVLYNLNKIISLRTLNELIGYDRNTNMDHVSSLKLLALWLSQERLAPVKYEEESAMKNRANDFFKEHAKRVRTKNPFYRY